MDRYIEIGIADDGLHIGEAVGTCAYLGHRKVSKVGRDYVFDPRNYDLPNGDGPIIWGRMVETVEPDDRLGLDTETGDVFKVREVFDRGRIQRIDPELVAFISKRISGCGLNPNIDRVPYSTDA